MSELKPEYVTKKQLAHDPALCFTEAMLSYYLLHRRRNGLDQAVRKIGRKLVIRKDLFLEWIENQSKGGIVVNENEEAALQNSESGLKSNSQIVSHLEISLNLEITKKFLRLFGKIDDAFTFQLFPEKEDSKQFPKVLHGTLQDLYPRLAEENSRGSGIFITINQTDGKGRKKENIISVRAVFVDLDGAPLQPVYSAPYPPHLVTESSPGRFHAYWSIHGCPVERFSDIQRLLAEKFSSDPQVHDLSRCMRLPGFYHLKSSPFLTTIIDNAIAAPIAFNAFEQAFGIHEVPSKPLTPNFSTNNVLQTLCEYKMVLANHSSPQGCWTIKCPWEQNQHYLKKKIGWGRKSQCIKHMALMLWLLYHDMNLP